MGDNRRGSAAESLGMSMSTTTADLELEHDPEAERVLLWREEELERVGYERETARDLAERSHVDLHHARDLLRHGCPADNPVGVLLQVHSARLFLHTAGVRLLASIPSPSSGEVSVGGIELHAYGVMLLLGILAATW